MSKREALSRYFLIIQKIRKKPSSYTEISDHLAYESELQSYNFNISKRTFQRDLEDIRSIFSIDIQYDFSKKVYYIDMDQLTKSNERILEAFDTFQALNLSDRLSDNIHFENRRPQGTEHLHGMLHAINHKKIITFTYQKFWENKSTVRKVAPLAIKEFRNRWYVVAEDSRDHAIKTFGLDRLSNLDITKKNYQMTTDFDVNEYFRYCFGIISPNSNMPKEVVLSFDPIQGKYIKTLPLHHTQQVLIDNDKELRIRLKVYITFDFVMEILSYGDKLQIIKPKQLIDEVLNTYKKAMKSYDNL